MRCCVWICDKLYYVWISDEVYSVQCDEIYCSDFKFSAVQLVIPISVRKIRFQANLRRLGVGPS
jgi:hypothetical protein